MGLRNQKAYTHLYIVRCTTPDVEHTHDGK